MADIPVVLLSGWIRKTTTLKHLLETQSTKADGAKIGRGKRCGSCQHTDVKPTATPPQSQQKMEVHPGLYACVLTVAYAALQLMDLREHTEMLFMQGTLDVVVIESTE